MLLHKDWKNKKGIYKLSINSRFYIGSSTDLYRRIWLHLKQLKCNNHHSIFMQRSYNKYQHINIEILEYCDCSIDELRKKELYYINEYKPVFNSTTPITYVSTNEVKERISKTLVERYKNGSLKHWHSGKGILISIYDLLGNILIESVTVQKTVEFINLSNRSVINNAIRKKRFLSKKKFIFVPTSANYFEYIKNCLLSNGGLNVPILQISEDKIIRCSTSSSIKIRHKILNDETLVYYSKKNKSYYTFAGLFNNAVLNGDIKNYKGANSVDSAY